MGGGAGSPKIISKTFGKGLEWLKGLFKKGLSGAEVKIGTSFGKLGTLVQNPLINVNWNMNSVHGLEKMAERGITQEMVNAWVASGKALQQSGGQYLFVSKDGVAVVSQNGKLITAYTKKTFDHNMVDMVNRLYGK